jgi:hypothetical protein
MFVQKNMMLRRGIMNKAIKWITFLIIVICVIVLAKMHSVSAAEQIYPFTIPQGQPYTLSIPCSVNGYYCNALTNCNISIILSQSAENIVNNKAMTLSGEFMKYSLLSNQTSELGEYQTSIICIDTNTNLNQSISFTYLNTPTGRQITTEQTILYAVLFGFTLFILCMCIYLAVNTNSQNALNEEGQLLHVNFRKYIKYLAIGLSYVFTIVILYLAYVISSQMLYLNAFGNIFYAFFSILSILAIPLFFFAGFMIIYKFIKDIYKTRLIGKGRAVYEH